MAHLFLWENFFFIIIWLDWQKVNFKDSPGTDLLYTGSVLLIKFWGFLTLNSMFAWLAFDDWATSEVLNLYFCRICSAGFFYVQKIICSRPASWDCHFINRNRCLEKLQGLVAKRKDPQTRQLCKPKSLLLCLYSSVYMTFCLPECSSISFPIQLQESSTYLSR